MLSDKIEIPPTFLLDQNRITVNEFKILGKMLAHFTVGWSYYLEWAWMFDQIDVKEMKGKKVLDAGAGLGLCQWHLAENGIQVYSVDRLSRACLPSTLRKRYFVKGMRGEDLLPVEKIINPLDRSAGAREKLRFLVRSIKGGLARLPSGRAPGIVYIYNQDLENLVDIPDNSIDLIVSTSALEHNTPEGLRRVVVELLRVLKPEGAIVATLAAAKESDTYHSPSHSWCYTENTLKSIFDLPKDAASNYSDYEALLLSVRECAEMRKALAVYYYLSGKNGMPWGKWDPAYLPVGIVKVKHWLKSSIPHR